MKFWTDGTIEELSPNAKLLMLYFITSPYRNESGLYSITTKRMSDDTGLNTKQRDNALKELAEKERVFYDTDESVIWVVNAIRHISPNDNCKKSVRNDIEYCSSRKLVQSLLFYYKSISYLWVTNGFTIDSEPIYRVHGIGYKVHGTWIEEKSEFDFDSLWKRYPRRLGKKDALRHFNASVKTEEDWKNINLALDHYLQTENVKKGNMQYIQHGSTWFNNWQDWIEGETKSEIPSAIEISRRFEQQKWT